MKSTVKLGYSTSISIQPSTEGQHALLTVQEGFLSVTREATRDQWLAIRAAGDRAFAVIDQREQKAPAL